MFIKKLKASGLHLLLSLIMISLAMSLMVYFWFPHSFITISRFKEIALLIISVDLVLGPLLTFVIFKPKKKGLKFDLTAIAIIQTSALVYGLFALYQAHPVFVTFNIDRFTLVTAVDAKPENAVINEFKISKLSSPILAIAKLPTDKIEKSDLLMDVLSGQPDIAFRPELYHPYEENISEILVKSLDPKVIFKTEESKEKFNNFIKKHGKSKNDYAYLPLEGSFKDVVWVLDKQTAQPVGMITVNPWTKDYALKANKKTKDSRNEL